MIAFLKSNSVGSFLALLAIGFAVHAHLFLHPLDPAFVNDSGILSFLMWRYLGGISPVGLTLAYFLVLFLQAFRLNIYLADLKMYTQQQGVLSAMAYVLLSAIVPGWGSLTPGLLANTFVIWLFIYLSKLYSSQKPTSLLLNIGILTGISLLCYHPSFILVIVALFALAVIRPFKASEWVLLLMGSIIPMYLFASVLYLNNNLSLFYTILPRFQFKVPIAQTDWWLWVKLLSILIMILIGISHWNDQNNRMVIQLRKNWAAMMVMLFFMLPIPFIFRNVGFEAAVLCLPPMSAVIANGFVYPKKRACRS